MSGFLAALVVSVSLARPLAAADDKASQLYVNGRVERTSASSFVVSEPLLSVNLSLSGFGSGLSFSGQPFSGSVSRAGNLWSVFGAGVTGTVNAWGGDYRVSATVYPAAPRQQPLRLSFSVQTAGRTDDPQNPPSYTVWGQGVNLTVRPALDGREYDMTGWVDKDQFGPSGVGLTGVIVAAAMNARPAVK